MSAIGDLLRDIVADVRARHPERPALIGVAGAQGCGKTTLCTAFAAKNGGRVAHFSLDDVYLTRAQRQQLADALHPLFVTRGPPGTHDLSLARGAIARLFHGDPTPLPRFDKNEDDRAPEETWPVFVGPAEAVLIDGWCMGALPPPDGPALNAVEREDADGDWRAAIGEFLRADYGPFFDAFDEIVYLQPPSWEIVRRWRGEQEEKMLKRSLNASESAALDRFVMHYERVTRQMIAGHHSARWIVRLDEKRNVVGVERRQ